MAAPAYSTAQPEAPVAPSRPMACRIRSFALVPAGSVPSKRMRIWRGRCSTMVWVAATCWNSVAPMPKASAPSAPWVQVWLSLQTTEAPGNVSPSSGPTTCTMPCPGWPTSNRRMPCSRVSWRRSAR